LKVAFFSHYSGLYGANRCLLSLTQGLKEKGVEPIVFLPKEGPVEDKLRQNGTAHRTIPYSSWVSKQWNFKRALRKTLGNLVCSRRLAKSLAPLGISLVHSNSSVTNIGAFVASRLKVPHVWHMREFGDLDYGIRPEWGRKLFLGSIRRADAIVFISATLRSHFWERNPPPNAHVIYDGIARKEEFKARRVEATQRRGAKACGTPFTFILVGLFQPQKGQDIAIRALYLAQKWHPDLRLWLVGSGSEAYVERCRALAAELGIAPKVKFFGFLDDPNPLYREADCGLTCSQSEAFGLVTAEAMSFCRPVIGFRGGATPELVKPGETGLLYSGGHEELAACMDKMASSPNWCSELGEKAFSLVSHSFSTEEHSETVFSQYQDVLTNGSGIRTSGRKDSPDRGLR
jgi:glycosyltransferase involved in cell wall biosynthesis